MNIESKHEASLPHRRQRFTTCFFFLLDPPLCWNLPKEVKMFKELEKAAGPLSLFIDYWNWHSSSPGTHLSLCARDQQKFIMFCSLKGILPLLLHQAHIGMKLLVLLPITLLFGFTFTALDVICSPQQVITITWAHVTQNLCVKLFCSQMLLLQSLEVCEHSCNWHPYFYLFANLP